MYLNIDESDLCKYIYRIIPYDRLLELFETQKNTLVKPELWEDTFENFVLKSKLRTKDNKVIQYNVHDKLYGQCWTLEKSSDAMWQIHSKDKSSIRIRTTIGDLFNSLNEASIETPKCLYSIGKVEYIKEDELVNKAKGTFENNGNVRFGNLFRSLLIKREAFRHENEIRLMFLNWSEDVFGKKIYRYSIEPHNLISQMVIDPRLLINEVKKIEFKIRKLTGYEGEIKRSLLYRIPEDLVFNIDGP